MEEKIAEANKEIQEVLNKKGLKLSYDMSFPIYKILPDEVKLSLLVLEKHGMKLSIVLKPNENNTEEK